MKGLMRFLGLAIVIEAVGLLLIIVSALSASIDIGGTFLTENRTIIVITGLCLCIPATLYFILFFAIRLFGHHDGDKLITSLHQNQKNAGAIVNDLQTKNSVLSTTVGKYKQKEIEQAEQKRRSIEKRKLAAAEKRQLLSRENLERYTRKYFAEIAACFLMNRNAYKDKFGISPYNKIIINDEKVELVMAVTRDKLYKFAEILPDVEIFFKTKRLSDMFKQLLSDETTMVQISEKLHVLYLQFFRDDFIKDYRKRIDFENMLIIAANYYIMRDLNLSEIYTNVTFDAGEHFTDADITIYLSNSEVSDNFRLAFKNYSDLGFENLTQAYVTCFFASQKDRIGTEELINAILKDINRLTKLLTKKK